MTEAPAVLGTRAAMLSAIAERPDEVTGRLVYCDWLAEFGSEDDWQDYLDLHPDHHEVRERFGVWLDERGDERAAGYRRLGELKKYPRIAGDLSVLPRGFAWFWWDEWNDTSQQYRDSAIPMRWYQAVEGLGPRHHGFLPAHAEVDRLVPRAEVENAFARAYRPEFEEPQS